jgi:PHD/YefM family antitoxin component YafN of YafNO toxin-antitoxin module
MKLKTVSVEQLGLETAKVVDEARKHPVVVRSPGKPALILRRLVEDDAADELVIQSPEFRASIRAARHRRAAGKGISLAAARSRLGA